MNILTFDIEEWFHIKFDDEFLEDNYINNLERRLEANMHFILNILDKFNQKATFFCLGWVAKNYPNLIKEINKRGHEIGSHSDKHKLLFNLSELEFKEDLKNSINSIEDLIDKKIKLYRAPSFSLTNSNSWVIEELINFGITIDCSIFPAKRSDGGFIDFISSNPSIIQASNSKKIKEFPINTLNFLGKNIIFSGGGYFRIIPSFILKKMFRESKYIMTYFHPRDFDPDQPILKNITPLKYFKSYVGLKKSRKKIEMLLNNFNFINISEADKLIDWTSAPVHKL